MSMMQMLFFSAGTLTETPFNQNTPNKPLTSVISLGEENTLTFPIPGGVSNVSVQAWGAGGASGGSVNGVSGAGGGGGYISASIPVDQLNINSLIIKVGGGGGNPTYYENNSIEYSTTNRANISFVGSNSVSSNPTYSTISQVGTAVNSVSSPTYNTIQHVSSVSGTNITSLDIPIGTLQANDIVLVASVCATGTGVHPNPSLPTGYTSLRNGSANNNVNYRLSFKRITAAEATTNLTAPITISNLDNSITDDDGNGNPFIVAHTASVFRNVFSLNSAVFATATAGNPNPPALNNANAPETPNYMSVAFGFLNDRSIADANITAPTTPNVYTKTITQAVGTDNAANNEATIMVAHRNLTSSGPEDPGPFTVSDPDGYTAITVGLMPTKTLTPIAGTLPFPTGTTTNDIVLVASVSDGAATPILTPTGYTQISASAAGASPAYCLSYRRIIAGDTQVSGLPTSGQIVGGLANGQPAGIAHVAMSFRGVVTTGNPIVTNATPATLGTGDPDPPSIISNTINFASVAFGFINNISVGSIPPPTNYTTLINQPVGADPTGTTEATLMSAFRSLTVSGTENPLTFDTGGGTNDFAAVTVGLRPQTIITAVPNTIDLTTPFSANPLRENDIVLVASISDGGTMNLPLNGYATLDSGSNANQPAYHLSWKRMGPIPDTAVTGLSATGTVQGGNNDGEIAGVAHVAIAFRGVSPTTNPRIQVGPAANGTPNPPSIGGLSLGDAVVAFGFLDDRSVNATAGSANYTIARNQAVGTDAGGNDEATIMSAYRLNITTASEDPPAFGIGGVTDNYIAASIALTPQVNNTFSVNPGSCGGSGGGFSGVFYTPAGSPPGTLVPLLIAGGGGGGGGATVASSLPVGILAGVPAGGSGGPGGGLPGGNGNAFVLNALSQYFYAGQGGGAGGDGAVSFGGARGLTYYFDGLSVAIANLTNPGENGTIWDSPVVSGFSTGGRGANSPSSDSITIPLYGANGSGGWIRGAGGGSSRTSSTSVPVAVPSDCGGGGGAGYYGGGGGGSGAGGGGGGGGGGSNYVSLDIFVSSNIAGIGTVPGSPIVGSLIGYGGASITGTGSIIDLGNPGQNGLVIVSYVG
jgi:hypothetical protein